MQALGLRMDLRVAYARWPITDSSDQHREIARCGACRIKAWSPGVTLT